MATFFSDFFAVDPEQIESYGAFNVSLINDLPLFIDPFLLFQSEKPKYGELHDGMIAYLSFLRDRAAEGSVSEGSLRHWYCFPEVKQNWLGFSVSGNAGSGLGIKFARRLHSNLSRLFADFGKEKITEASHLEKVCLIADGVGRDNISDFTTNLIKDYLCQFTQQFALEHLDASETKEVAVKNGLFDYKHGVWRSKIYRLPWHDSDYILLTPKDMLTRDENWISKRDLIDGFEAIPVAIPDSQLRAQVSDYFYRQLVRPRGTTATKSEAREAAVSTVIRFPEVIDYYIRMKEQTGDQAEDISSQKVAATEAFYIHQLRELQISLLRHTDYYETSDGTYVEAHRRLAYLKDVIENKGGHRIFYHKGRPVEREADLQILYRLVWYGTPSDVGREANDGRGPVDFKISRGRHDKTLVEMKLAKNTHLEQNLVNQLPIYQRASDAKNGIKAIIFFTYEEEWRARRILEKLGLTGHKDIILIDARADNKPSGSKA